jgi:putative transposase
MFQFIHDHRGTWPIRLMCRVLGVSAGGYYDWRDRPPSPTADRRDALTVEVKAVHAEAKARYGSPRVHAELAARGVRCCVNTVAKLMRAAGVRAKTARRFRCTTDSNHDRPVAENVLDREFTPVGPNASWVADITYIPTAEGWVYLAAVEDLYSRAVGGWSMGSRIDSRLVVDALEMALARRCPGEGLVSHSDRGSPYASEHYRRVLAENGIVCSMSRRGDCWDNAPMESFFATLKKELVHHESYKTREEARASVFEYIEAFYNRVRRHSALGYKSPAEYEQAA